jgi:hypothetical protein
VVIHPAIHRVILRFLRWEMGNLRVARQHRSRMGRCRAGAGEEVMRASREEALLNRLAMVSFRAAEEAAEEALLNRLAMVSFRAAEEAAEEALLNRLAMVSFRAAGEAAEVEEVELPTKLARVKFRVPLDSKGFDEVMSVRERVGDGVKV